MQLYVQRMRTLDLQYLIATSPADRQSIVDRQTANHKGMSSLLAANHLGRALYSDLYADPAAAPNFGRFTFLDGAARRFYPDFNLAAEMLVSNLRTAAGKDPHDKGLQDLVGELSTRSDDFRRRWGSHNVRTRAEALSHEPSERANTVTWPWPAATAARPHAMAPDPAIARRSDMENCLLTRS